MVRSQVTTKAAQELMDTGGSGQAKVGIGHDDASPNLKGW